MSKAQILFSRDEAEAFTPEEAIGKFVPNRVWNEIRDADHNRLLLGGVGTGKSIVLKRMSAPAMSQAPDFLSGKPFFATLCDVRELEFLDAIEETEQLKSTFVGPPPTSAQRVVEAAWSLAVAKATVQSVVDACSTSDVYAPTEKMLGGVCAALQRLFPYINSSSADELVSDLDFALNRIRVAAVSQGAVTEHLQGEHSLLATATSLASALNRSLPRGCRVGFLFDQYDMVGQYSRWVCNSLMRRANKHAFFTVVAARPYNFRLPAALGALIPKEDFNVSVVEYLPDDELAYVSLLRAVVGQIFEAHDITHVSIDNVLPCEGELTQPTIEECRKALGLDRHTESLLQGCIGFENFARLSSGSIRAFLRLCKQAVIEDPGHGLAEGVSLDAQMRAVAYEVKNEADRIRAIPTAACGLLLRFLGFVRDRVVRHAPKATAPCAPKKVRVVSEELFPLDESSNVGSLLAAGLRDSALQYCTPDDVGFALPTAFRLRNLICPLLGLQLDQKGAIDIRAAEVGRFIDSSFARKRAQKDEGGTSKNARTQTPRIFLSTSFSGTKDHISALRAAFRQGESDIVLGSAFGAVQMEQIHEQIKQCDLTLAELSQLRPNVMLEMGLSVGNSKPVIPLIASDPISSKPKFSDWCFLRTQGYINYDFSPHSLGNVVNLVLDFWTKGDHRFATIDRPTAGRESGPGRKLRVKNPGKSDVFLYLPDAVRERLRRGYANVRSHLDANGFEVRSLEDAPDNYETPEAAVWALTRSSYVIVDTTGDDAPDLLGCFLLGFAQATANRKRRILRTELDGKNLRDKLSMWPSRSTYYRSWKDSSEFERIVRQTCTRPKRRR